MAEYGRDVVNEELGALSGYIKSYMANTFFDESENKISNDLVENLEVKLACYSFFEK